MSGKRQGVYSHQYLNRLFSPRSVAIVGVSDKPKVFGTRTVANLEGGGFTGRIYPVNAKYKELGGRICYPSLKELPEAPDLVVIAIARETVEPVVMDAAACGAGGIVLYSSGYAETDKTDRIAQQQRLIDLAREAKMPLVGPNCIGFQNYMSRVIITFAEVSLTHQPRPRAIGVITQSGALSHSLAQAVERGVSTSYVMTSGNASDVDVADQISYLAAEPGCAAIACMIEGMSTPERLLEAAEIAHAAGKPIIMYKMGTSERGAAQAFLHTATPAGSTAAWGALFRRAGIAAVDHIEALMETASFFAKAPRPKADGVAVVATSGGACIISADKAAEHGVSLPQPGPEARAVLEKIVPEFGSPKNPCDVTAQVLASPESLYTCTDMLMKDDHFATVALVHPVATHNNAPRARVLSEAAKRYGKIASLLWTAQYLEGPGTLEFEADPQMALFRSFDRFFHTMAEWVALEHWRRAQPRRVSRIAPAEAAQAVGRLVDASGNGTLTGRAALNALSSYGIPVADDREALGVAGAADVELVVRARIDPLFGPLVSTGLGGRLEQLLKPATELAPVNAAEARDMLGRMQGAATAFPPNSVESADLPELADMVCRISELAADQAGRITELEVGILGPEGRCNATYARIVRK